jgi:hypothetical protein
MSEQVAAPGWLIPGAEVVVYNDGNSPAVRVTTVLKVAKLSFTVNGEDTRFRVARQDARQGGTWGWTRRCVPVGSDKAAQILDQHRRDKLMARARAACNDWLSVRDPENLDAAIEALQALKDDEGDSR